MTTTTHEELEKKCALQQLKLAALNELMEGVEKACDIAKAGIEKLQLQNEELAVQLANAESKGRELAAELSAVDKIHKEAVFITDDHYEQCPPEVQKMIRSLAVLQIPAYQAFLAEVRAQGVDAAIEHLSKKFEGTGHLGVPIMALEWLAQELRKGAAL